MLHHWSGEEKGQCKDCITIINTNFLPHMGTVLLDC